MKLAYGADEGLLLSVVGSSLVARDAVTLGTGWTMPFEAPLFAVAFVGASVLPPTGDSPWRASAVGDACAVVVDQGGDVFFVDVGSQRIMTQLRGTTAPFATAATRSAFALGDGNGTRVWRDGEISSFAESATALGLDDDEIALAADGHVAVYTLATKALRETWHVGGLVVALARRPSGVWYAGNEHGLFGIHAKPERIHDGDVRSIVVDPLGKRFALQRTESHVAVYAWDSFEPQLRLTGPVDGLVFVRTKLIALAPHGVLNEVDVRTGAKRIAR